MLLENAQFVLGLACALLIGLAKGGLTAGLGTLVVPILSLTIDPRVAVALTLPILMISDWFAVWAYWGKADRGHLKVMLIGSVIGIAIGTATFHIVSEPMMRLLMGVLSLSYIASRFVGIGKPSAVYVPPETGPGMFWGAMCGFTSFTAHAGGPPVQVYLLPKGLNKLTYQATNVMLFTLVNLFKVPGYIMLGQFTQPVMVTALALMPAAALGVYLGYKLQNLIPEHIFFRLMIVLLGLTGLKLTWDGLRALLAG